MFGVAALATAMMMVSRAAAVVIALVGVAVLAPMAVRVNGRTGVTILASYVAWWLGKAQRRHMYISGAASAVSGKHRLPGLLAASQMWQVESGRYGHIGVVVIPATRHYTVTLRCDTDGLDLVDQEVIDQRVARFAGWLGSLCREPMIAQATCTVESAPDPGTRLALEVATTTRDDAPALARQVLDEVVATYPTGAATIHTRVSLTFTPQGKRRLSHQEMCREIAMRLPGLQASLIGTGVSTATPMSPSELAATVRAAYDPAIAVELARAGEGAGIEWEQAGPVAAREKWDHYIHDNGVSKTWGMEHAPRGIIAATLFARLTDPDGQLLRKRVSLVWRPYSPIEATNLVERDKKDARFEAGKKHRSTARDDVDVAAADQSASEEARGAGMTAFTVIVTATVSEDSELDEAETAVMSRAGQARFHLRPMNATQAAAFAATLPAGVVLPAHTTIQF